MEDSLYISNSNMKKGFTKILICFVTVLLCLYCFDCIFGYIMRFISHKNLEKEHCGLNYCLNAATADIIILGSSSARSNYVPQLIGDSINTRYGTKYSIYNTGNTYQDYPYFYCEMKSLIDRKVPKIVIIDLQPWTLAGSTNMSALKYMRPYYSVNSNVKKVLDDNETFLHRVLMNFEMYKYNEEFFDLLTSFLHPTTKYPLGFWALDGEEKDYKIIPEKDTRKVNPLSRQELEKTIQIAQNKGIELFICISPYLRYIDRNSPAYKEIVNLCAQYNIPFFDYSNDLELVKGELFHDTMHLNKKGANIFSNKLTSQILKSLSKKHNSN